jgi:hypothetical protein
MLLAAGLVAAPYAVAANAKSSPSGPPPIEQPLVREGEFAVELATALNLTSLRDEAAAESSLISIGIMPRNGWISDYPMTPDIIAEVRDSAARSAISGHLRISATYAADIVDKVGIAMNLPVKTAGGEYNYASNSQYPPGSGAPAPGTSEYVEPSLVEHYYHDNEPPIITYYPPPEEYAYLYDWVPDPFWWDGFGFGGYFILIDFNRRYHDHHITNHVTQANGTVSRIDPTTRAGAITTANTANTSAPRGFTSSGSARDTDGTTRNMDRSTSSPQVSRGTASGGGMGGFHGGGGMGGFHGGGGGRR